MDQNTTPYAVIKTLATLSENDSYAKRLRIVTWRGSPGKLDLRSWRKQLDGEELPGKGMTLTLREARVLADTLTEYLEKE